MSGYILFQTTAAAFLCESLLKSQHIKVKLTPTPRFFSSDCGISAYFWDESLEKVEIFLRSKNLDFELKEYKDEYLEKK